MESTQSSRARVVGATSRGSRALYDTMTPYPAAVGKKGPIKTDLRFGVFLSGASSKVLFSSCLAWYVCDVGLSVPGLCNEWIAFIFY